MKLYIAGPMRGYDNYNFPAFWHAATKLRYAGHEVMSPAEIDIVKGRTEITCTCGRDVILTEHSQPVDFRGATCGLEGELVVTWLIESDPDAIAEMFRNDFEAIIWSEGIVLLPGWEDSNGARSELGVALALAKPVYLYAESGATPSIVPITPYLRAGVELSDRIAWEPNPEPLGGEMPVPADEFVERVKGKFADGETRVVDPVTGGAKGSKLARFDLIPPEVEWELAEHYGKNAEEHGGKYPARNWQKGYAWSLSIAALRRHLTAWLEGEEFDQDTGTHHLVAVQWHAIALRWFTIYGAGTDDRQLGLVAA